VVTVGRNLARGSSDLPDVGGEPGPLRDELGSSGVSGDADGGLDESAPEDGSPGLDAESWPDEPEPGCESFELPDAPDEPEPEWSPVPVPESPLAASSLEPPPDDEPLEP
jgi:hypothetical protein